MSNAKNNSGIAYVKSVIKYIVFKCKEWLGYAEFIDAVMKTDYFQYHSPGKLN